MTVENRAYELKPGDPIYLQKDTFKRWNQRGDTFVLPRWMVVSTRIRPEELLQPILFELPSETRSRFPFLFHGWH